MSVYQFNSTGCVYVCVWGGGAVKGGVRRDGPSLLTVVISFPFSSGAAEGSVSGSPAARRNVDGK